MHLLLIRHGETDWNSEGRKQGHTDTPLNARGFEQAEKLPARLAAEKIDAVYTSSLARAHATAELVAQKHGLAPIPDDRLKEKYLGEFEGLTSAEFEQQNVDLYHAWRASKEYNPLPGEEAPLAFRQHVQDFLNQVQSRHKEANQVEVVSHVGTLGMFLATLIGPEINRRSPFWFDNASISRVDLSGGRPRLRLLNDTCHLQNGHAN
jgi:probable phosphoglycerate mutase